MIETKGKLNTYCLSSPFITVGEKIEVLIRLRFGALLFFFTKVFSICVVFIYGIQELKTAGYLLHEQTVK
jgi:hypothetical protein